MAPEDRVAVVIPARDAERTLREAAGSVSAQSLPELEVVLVDDGSRDATGALCEELAEADPRFSVVRQRNVGCAAARNVGIAHTRAPLIAFLDADDRWHPDFLHRLAARFAAEPDLGIAYARVRFMDVEGRVFPRASRIPRRLLREDLLYENPLCCGSNLMMRREIAEKCGGFDASLRRLEDIDFLLRALRDERWAIRGTGAALVDYRVGRGLAADFEGMLAAFERVLAKLRREEPTLARAHAAPARAAFVLGLTRRGLHAGYPPALALRRLRRLRVADLGRLLVRRPRTTLTLARILASVATGRSRWTNARGGRRP